MVIQVSDLTKSYSDRVIFDRASLLINEGERVALVGENGAGKSTLFRILIGSETADSGQVSRSKGMRIGYLPQEPEAPPAVTVYDFVSRASSDLAAIESRLRELEQRMADPAFSNDEALTASVFDEYSQLQDQFEKQGGYGRDAVTQSALLGLGFKEHQYSQLMSTLSGGEKKLAALAALLVASPHLLLLDEPDNHLDLGAKEWLAHFIESYRGSVLLVSHDRFFLDQCANRVLELEDGRLHAYAGNYTHSRTEKQARLERDDQLHRLHQRELVELERSAKQLQEWAALNKKLAGRARNRRRMLEERKEELANTPVPVVNRKTVKFSFEAGRSGRSAVEIRDLSLAVDGRVLFDPFSFDVRYGDRVGLVGANGSGKTTLFRAIMGSVAPAAGSLKLGANVKIGYYSQGQETLPIDSTPVEFVRSLRAMYEDQAVAMLRSQLLFKYADCFVTIGRLSGGQKSRLQIISLSLQGANLLLLDEPTNNLDIPSMEVLEAALEEFDGTVIAISHDRYFLDTMVDSILAIEPGGVHLYPGNFGYYFDKTGGAVHLGW
jgi:ATP-binding cassette subfamily F protein 3